MRTCGGKPGWAVIIYREFVDVYLFTRLEPNFRRPIDYACLYRGNYKFLRLPVVLTLPYSCARHRSSQPQSPLRLILRSQMFRKLWLAYLSALQTFLNRFSAPLPLSPVWPQHLSFKFLRPRRLEDRLLSSGPMSPTIRTVSFSLPYVLEHLDLF